MTQKVIEFGFMLPRSKVDAICAALGIRFTDLDSMCPMRIVSTGHSKVLVGINDEALLDRLAPNLEALAQLSGVLGCNGYYVFTLNHLDRRFSARGRMFAPAIGIPEDPVTGNANGPLGAYLVLHNLVSHDGTKAYLNNEQGRAIGRSGNVKVEVDISNGCPVRVKVSGRAVLVYEATLRV